MKVEKTLTQSLACQLLFQVLFSFDQGISVEKTLIQTLACQLLSILIATLVLVPNRTKITLKRMTHLVTSEIDSFLV